MNIYDKLLNYYENLIVQNNIEFENIDVSLKTLTEEEAIGITTRKDYPLLNGKEVLVEANFRGSLGQAFTSARTALSIKLSEVKNLNIGENEYDTAIFISTLNAVMKYLGLITGTKHCKNEEPELCAKQIADFLSENKTKKFLLIGYQPAFIDKLSSYEYNLRVLDLNPDNIGEIKYGVEIESGEIYKEAIEWSDIILCTGSTIINGSILNFMDLKDKDVYFYGTTIAGPAKILNLKRLCYFSK
ncbi:Rossmann-like domain-containing protein [Peptoniphilus asaccharolyticus]